MSREFEEKMNSLIPMVVEQTSKEKELKSLLKVTEREDCLVAQQMML